MVSKEDFKKYKQMVKNNSYNLKEILFELLGEEECM